MRRESSTVVVVTGEVGEDLLTGLARSANVSVARAPAAGAGVAADAGSGSGPPPAGWQAGAAALHEAARRQSTYVIVPEDPLGEVAASWRAMWDGPGGAAAAARFEEQAADALAAWRGHHFELPDYYLVVAPARTCTWARCARRGRAGWRWPSWPAARPSRGPGCSARWRRWSTARGGRRWTS